MTEKQYTEQKNIRDLYNDLRNMPEVEKEIDLKISELIEICKSKLKEPCE